MEHYCYILSDPSRGNESIYVGKGKGSRAWSHFKRTDKHPLTNRLKTMESLKVKANVSIYSGFDEEFAFFLEEELIAKIGRKDLETGPLLNMTKGGEGKVKSITSQETKEKLRIAGRNRKQTAEAKLKISQSRQQMSEETREKIRAAAKSRKSNPRRSEETKDKIRAARIAYFACKKENEL